MWRTEYGLSSRTRAAIICLKLASAIVMCEDVEEVQASVQHVYQFYHCRTGAGASKWINVEATQAFRKLFTLE